ncbi:MAG: universal stress protein [Pseudomonadota bacterium]
MFFKTILVHVDGSRHVDGRIEIAARLAALHDAHLVGLALTDLPQVFYDPMMFNPVELTLDPLLQAPRQRAADALDNFTQTARQFHSGSIETRLEENESALGVSLQARYADLVVLGQYDAEDADASANADFAKIVIMEGGVPVLMVPFASAVANTGRRALVSWNASKQAVRAVHYALPLLQRASQVDVAVFDPQTLPAGQRAVPDEDIIEFLARHGIKANVKRQVTAGDIDIGNALLSLATDLGSDLLVMGCYGHTRLREVLLGGVSRAIFRSMTLPVLMAH